jgi:hypothetical protein
MDLLELGANVQAIGGSYLCTPLHYAASEGHKSICLLLLASNADRGSKDVEQKTPFDLAEDEAIKRLLRPVRRVTEVMVPRNTEAVMAPFLPGGVDTRGDISGDYEHVCKICLEAPIETILLPCGHQAFCFDCASRITECALDRQPIQEVMRVFRVE